MHDMKQEEGLHADSSFVSMPQRGPMSASSLSIDGAPPGTDYLTGALNMPAFGAIFVKEILPARRNLAAVWYIDLRHFRSVNPKYGFPKGNEILVGLVQSIRSILSRNNPVVRLGADRFVFMTDGLDYEQAKEGFFKLDEALKRSALKAGVRVPLAIAGGIYYLCDVDYNAGNHINAMNYVSIAHKNARNERRSTLVMFSDEDLEQDNRRLVIEKSFDAALEAEQIEVWYQPQFDYIYGEVIGVEALARWDHPGLGWLEPTEFIPILEDCGKVHDLDLFVWEEACRSAGRWRNTSYEKPVPVSVNVSRSELFEHDIVQHFLKLKQKYDLPDGSLRIEIAEEVFLEEAERLEEIVNEMHKHKMLVEMDDFGKGYTSFNALKGLNVDAVKMDIDFVKSAISEDRGGVVLGSVIRMLQGLDIPIIAEGIESREQAEMLKNMGCYYMQGFLFSRPLPRNEFEGFIASTNTDDNSLSKRNQASHLDDLTRFDSTSSYLFNNVMGGTIFFSINNGITESILVNDEFYKCCGLQRDEFGNKKVNPIAEIDEESRKTMWRACAEARENGAALGRAKVRLTGRWIDGIIRYLGSSARGDIFSLMVYRWGDLAGSAENKLVQSEYDSAWALSIMDKVLPSGYLKIAIDDEMLIDYASSGFVENTGLSYEEFLRRYHNLFSEFVVLSDRVKLRNALLDALKTGDLIDMNLTVHYGFSGERVAHFYGRADYSDSGKPWCYAVVLFKDMNEKGLVSFDSDVRREHIITFDYTFADDRLIIHDLHAKAGTRDIILDNWLRELDSFPANISKFSASKILATMRDLRHHPSSGFTDLKCNLRGGNAQRWYHINFACETDEHGLAVSLHGYAQDANDHMGSAKWWRRQAEIDQLTGLLNRNTVEQDINMSMRTNGAGMMFMIDLDSFKRVNDDLGHLTGDALLRDVANALSESFREGDVLGRYGGDEFVAFVPVAAGDPHSIAENRCRRIIQAVSSIEISDGVHAGCSIGVAISRNRESTFYDLLEVADQAMYRSKLTGKGCYTLFDMD